MTLEDAKVKIEKAKVFLEEFLGEYLPVQEAYCPNSFIPVKRAYELLDEIEISDTPLPVEDEKERDARVLAEYKKYCETHDVPKPSEPAFKFGDEVEAWDNAAKTCHKYYLCPCNGRYLVSDQKPIAKDGTPFEFIGGVFVFSFVRPIPAKPTLEAVIEEALVEVWNLGLNQTVRKARTLEPFVQRIKKAMEEQGK